MAEVTYVRSIGLVLPDARATLVTTASVYTEADSVPGLVEPQQASSLVVYAAGPAPSSTLLLRTQQGGLVGGDYPARFVWRASTTTGDFFGCDEPYTLSATQAVVTAGPGLDNAETADPHAIALPDGTIAVAHYRRLTALSPAYAVVCTRLGLDGTTDAGTVRSSVAAPSLPYRPALARLPSGRLLCYSWSADSGSSTAQIRCDYSDDDGETWGMASEAVLPASLDTTTATPGRIRAAVVDGGVALFVQTTTTTATNHRDRITQYGSRDLGFHFDLIDRTDDTDGTVTRRGGALIDVVASGQDIVLVYVAADDLGLYSVAIGSPYESVWDLVPSVIDAANPYATESGTPTVMADYDGGATVDQSGAIWLTSRIQTRRAQVMHVLRDPAGSWTRVGESDIIGGTWLRTHTTTVYADDVTIAHTAGRTVALSIHAGTSTTYVGTLWGYALGGDTTVTLPPYQAAEEPDNQVSYHYTWWPCDLPSTFGYTAVTGAGTAALGAHYAEATTSANTLYWEDALPAITSATATYGLIRRFRVRLPTAGTGALTSAIVGCYFRVRDATESYEVELRLTGTGARLYDLTATAAVGSDVAGLTAATEYEWIVAIADGTARTWYRAWTWQGLTAWTAGPTGALTAGASGAAGVTVRWGNISAGTASSRWYMCASAWDVYTGAQLTAAQTNPDDLRARPWSGAMGTPVGSTGTRVFAEGHTTRGDDYHISATSDRPITALMRGSVRQGWASSTTLSQMSLVYDLSGGAGDTRPMSDVLVVAGFGSNIPEVQIYGVSSTSVDTLLVDQDLCAGMGGTTALHFVRSGDRVRPSTSAMDGDTPAFYHGELDGCEFAVLDSGTWYSRKIRRNSGGKWSATGGFRETLFLEGDLTGFPTSGTSAKIVPREWAVCISTRGAEYERIKVVIPQEGGAAAPGSADGTRAIGRLVIGYLHAALHLPSWGSRVTEETRTEIVRSRDDQRDGLELAPVRRRCRLGWVDGTNVYRVIDAEHGTVKGDADWFEVDSGTAAEPISWTGVELHTSGSILRITRGGIDPIVYLPTYDRMTSATRVYNRRDQLILGYIDGPVARDVVTGQTMHGELLRGDVIEIEEDR